MEVIYEDNHIIVVNKRSGEIVQGDKTGDTPLSELVKDYLKEKYQKPGAVFLGVTHRLDRPVSGLVVFAKTSKALTRLNKMFAEGQVHKTYWAIVEQTLSHPLPSGRGVVTSISTNTGNKTIYSPPYREGLGEGLLTHWLTRNEQQNKSYAHDHEVKGSKKAQLRYRVLSRGEHYDLVEVELLTGRHHQIRCQLSAIGMPIKGDLKYGARRSNPDGSISLMAKHIEFIHPVSKESLSIEAPVPSDTLWQALSHHLT